jgi:hypothetical protein
MFRAFEREDIGRVRIVLNTEIIDHVVNFNYLGSGTGFIKCSGLNVKLKKFQNLCDVR